MTFERKIVVGLEEIKGIIFQCNQCGSKIVIAPQSIEILPKTCPKNHPWNTNIPAEAYASSTLSVFTITLRKLIERQHEDNGFKVFLEFEETSSDAS